MSRELFKKVYDGESIVDMERDIAEAFDPEMNDRMADIPVDEHGFSKGSFVVEIRWEA